MSDETKHTPGPWFVQALHNTTGCRDIGPKYGDQRKKVDAVAVTVGLHDDKEDKANAHLIAAAPDLLEALKNLENDNGAIPNHAWKMVQDAIAKALGRETPV